ncbi:MAG: Coenzyme F420 hydrogenase/dehydrogenase, beta subunit C-terminal domain [Candidatus Lokiarchaeota archaeon]|nr:Coenzyme F420 hydrogenase/dehydrogenase, beta subunit C-terminal domain [Candidatus Lokiarchaeota archaeon]
MIDLNNEYDFNKIIPKKIIKATYKALNNYQYRTLFKYKDQILNYGKYNKDELNFILDSIIEGETARKYLLEELKSTEPLLLEEILNKFNFSDENIIRDLIFLTEQGFLEKIIDKSTGDQKYRVKEERFSLQKNIFDTISVVHEKNTCCHCGLCTSICPLDGIDLTNDYVYIDGGKCIRCGLCYSVCPQSFTFKTELDYLKKRNYDLKYYKNIGFYKNMYSARTYIHKIRDYIQDGGVVSSLIYYMLKNQLVDAVITIKHSIDFWKPEVAIIQDIKKLKNTAGTIYTHTPLLSVLKKTKNLKNVAIVALPCKIKALIKGSLFPVRLPFFNNIKYKIGLFCWESLSYEKMLEFIHKNFDVDLDEIVNMNIKKGKFIITLDSGDVFSIPLNEWYKYGYNFCNYCDDFTAEFADLSIGGIGSQMGWSTVITRNNNGEELFNKVLDAELIESRELKEGSSKLSLIEKIAEKKIKNSKSI